jgi:tRNA threonylcarbamoyladenosine biosynthesis protein TsaB
VAVPTLEAMAAQFPHAAHPICPALDARKGEVYAALYDTSTGLPRPLIAPAAVPPAPFLASLSGPVLFAGDGARLYRGEVVAALGEEARFAPSHLDRPSAAAVAVLGLFRLERGETEDLVNAEPIYLRKSEAEIQHEGGLKIINLPLKIEN